jgi:hypothetical protein
MDHRQIPLEVLREFVRSVAEQSSIRAVAEDAGVGRQTVFKFISRGSTPHPRIRRLLGLWYLRRLAGLDEMELLRPYFAALDVLLSDLTEPWRTVTTLYVLVGVERGYDDAGGPPPRWATVLRGRLARHGHGLIR